MREHPKKGQRITVKNGKLKGRQVEVINYLTSQFQGKSITRIKAPQFTTAMVNRGMPLDDDTVFVQFLPGMEFGCVHDSELKVKLEEVKTEAPALPENVENIKKGKRKKKDETETTPGQSS